MVVKKIATCGASTTTASAVNTASGNDVKSARAAVESDPRNITKIIDLGVAQSGARQFREAIATFTRGLEIEPANALLLRWRGHRYLSVREFDRAFADLTRGGAIDSTIYGIWYHLGVVQYLRGDFAAAAASFAKAQPIAPDAGELAGSTEWLCDVRRNHGGEVPAERELERQVRARDPGSDSFARDDPIAEVVARPFVDERRASIVIHVGQRAELLE